VVVIGEEIIVYLNMKNQILVLFSFILISVTAFSQSKDSLCIEFKKDTFYAKIASYLDLHKGDTLADIGAEYGYTIVRIAHYNPGVIFYEEDINRWITNRVFFKSTIKKACANVDINSFKYFRGTPTSTKFSDHFFKKIFIALSIHEFEFKEIMMQDIKRILRSDGHLYIMESFFKRPAEKEKNCKRPYLLKPDFLSLMKNAGFELVKEIEMLETDDASNTEFSFFEYKIKE